MKLEDAMQSMQASLVWGSWSDNQASAIKSLLIAAGKVKLLENENQELRKQLNSIDK